MTDNRTGQTVKDARCRSGPVRSMTGYAQVRTSTSFGELSVSLRSVNHRGLDLHFYLAPDFGPFENAIRGILKQHIGRGHVEVRASLTRGEGGTAWSCNRELLGHYLDLFKSTAEEFRLDTKPDLNVLFTLPGLFEQPRESGRVLNESFGADLIATFRRCVEELNNYRDREGGELRDVLQTEVGEIRDCTARMEELRSEATAYFQTRLRIRLNDLIGDSGLPESRMIEEAALLADRSDVAEELTRLSIHTEELGRILNGGGDVGKRMEFLLQEMNRETNTILSKTSGASDAALELSNAALAVKAHVERIREQALNLE